MFSLIRELGLVNFAKELWRRMGYLVVLNLVLLIWFIGLLFCAVFFYQS